VIDIDNDHNTQETAKRVAKMYIREVFKGRYQPVPSFKTFPNVKALDELYTTGPITIRSACSHHLVPIVGKCWIGVIPKDRLFGLSKFNRVVEWLASRPQIQEELAVQIADFLENELEPVGLAVVIKATHLCMTWRGVREEMASTMNTSVMRGKMLSVPSARAEFFQLIGQ
jgi:GTP cyclohydrolase I